jgi:hypothetical protein
MFLLAILLTSAAPALSADRTQEIIAQLQDLAASDATLRAAAREQLMGMAFEELPLLRRQVETASLKPAQIEPLQEIVLYVHTRYELSKAPRSEKGMLGIAFSFVPPNFNRGVARDENPPALLPGTAFSYRVPGFVAYRYLQDGDLIFAITADNTERPTPTRDTLTAAVSSFEPGKVVTVRVQRGGRMLDLTFPIDAGLMFNARGNVTTDAADVALQSAMNYWYEQFQPLIEPSGV